MSKDALTAMFPMITERLKKAHGIAAAAEACAFAGNYENAFRILLDTEELTHDAATLLNAASVIRREMGD
jgi:hypothetical protein